MNFIMSFQLTKTTKNFTVYQDYKQIAQDFAMEYYTAYDNGIDKLQHFYNNDAKFLYLDHEIVGYTNWANALRHNNFNKFNHGDMNVNVLPINDTNLLITIVGSVNINNSIFDNKFMENIVLERGYNNNFSVSNTIFKFV